MNQPNTFTIKVSLSPTSLRPIINTCYDHQIIAPTGLTGLEPATSAVTGQCSNQLNYSPFFSDAKVYCYSFSSICQASI